MNRRLPTLLAVSAISVAALGGQVAASGAAGGKSVTLKNIEFSPRKLSVSRGSSVTFRFKDDTTTHNVTSTGARRFKTISNRSSGSPARTFSRAGVYRYVCTLHPGMTGQITVR